MVDRELAEKMIERLNDMAKCDPLAFWFLLCMRVPCNQALAEHPTCQVGASNGGMVVGFIGILNGIVGNYDDGPKKGWGAIAAEYAPSEERSGEACAMFKGFRFIENEEKMDPSGIGMPGKRRRTIRYSD